MFRNGLLLSVCLFFIACGDVETSLDSNSETDNPLALVSLINAYDHQLEELTFLLNTQRDKQAIYDASQGLYYNAKVMLAVFANEQPECQDYIKALLQLSTKVVGDHPETLNKKGVLKGTLPEFNLPICYHLKDILLEPLALSSQAELLESGSEVSFIQEDIIELRAHVALLSNSVGFGAHL